MAMVVPGLIPSFWTSGFPEYPAIFAALAALAACRLLPPVAALVHHPPDPAGRVVGDVQGAVGAHGHTHRPVLRTGAVLAPEPVRERLEIGRASCRERGSRAGGAVGAEQRERIEEGGGPDAHRSLR